MTVNVRDFGAVGDGEHDDTAAFQAAIDAAAMETLPPDVVRTLEGRLRGVAAETARNRASDAQDAARYLLSAYAAGRQRSTMTLTPSRIEPTAERYPDRFRVGDGPWMPCRITGFDFTPSTPTPVAEAESFPWVALPDGPRGASPFELASYELAAEYQITPEQVDDLIRAYEAAVLPAVATAQAAVVDPELEAAKNWPVQGNVCAHVCGPGPGHVCDARATTTLRHPLPSGGTRTLPLCGPCADAEGAAEPGAADGEGEPVQGLDVAARGLAAGGWVTVPMQPPPVDRLFVIAATRVQFTEWCCEIGISPRNRRVVHVTEHRQVMGVPHGQRYLVLDWPTGPGFAAVAIRDALRSRDALGVSAEEYDAWRASITAEVTG